MKKTETLKNIVKFVQGKIDEHTLRKNLQSKKKS